MEIEMNKSQALRCSITPFAAIMFLLVLTVALSRAASPQDIEILDKSAKAFASVVKDAKPAVVHIQVSSTVETGQEMDQFFNNPFFERFFGPQYRQQQPQPRKRQQQGAGSGVIISKDGLIITNNHVVEKADKITVILSDNSEVEGKLVGTDPQSDIALIKIDVNKDLPTIPLGDSDKLEVGEWVIAIGNPFGLSQTVTVGVVSAKGRTRMGINEYEDFIQTDAAINPGNSGGPLLNIHGEVIGINSALYSRTGGYMGIGFAIPINMAKSIEDQLQKHGKVTRGWLGVAIQDIDENLAESFGLPKVEGILISDVQSGSPAEKAGLQQGDVLLKLANIPLKDVTDLRNRVAMIIPGTQISMNVIRNGKPVDIAVTIGEQPSDFGSIAQQQVPKTNGSLKDYGLTLQELTPDLAEQLGYQDRQGVVISEVEPQSPADNSGLKPGQLIEEVNKEKVTSLKEMNQLIQESENKNRILLKVRSGSLSQYVVLVLKAE